MPFYNDYNIGETMPEEMLDMFTGPQKYDEVLEDMAIQLYDKQKLGYLTSLRRSFTKVPYTMLNATNNITNPVVTPNGDVDVNQISELVN